jgi:hypothetical protein
MNVNALWSVQFYVPPSGSAVFGSGVVVLNNGKISGGDTNYYYDGSYTIVNGVFKSEVYAIHYSGNYNNVVGVGIKKVKYSLVGNADSQEFEINGHVVEIEGNPVNNGSPIAAKLERLAAI